MERTDAILLRKVRWSESSLIVTWLTARHGTLRTSVRGARRPRSAFAGQLDLFYRAEILVTLNPRGDLHTLREVGPVTPFDAARAGSAGYYLAAYFADLAGLCTPPMQPAPEWFDLLRRAIDHLQAKPASTAAFHHFEREACRILGVRDAAGTVSAPAALATLAGGLPSTRQEALRFLGDSENIPRAPGKISAKVIT